jgi:D-alanine-D-alanine ligase
MAAPALRSVTGTSRPRVVVISGGPGPEHDVSLAGGRAIARSLRATGYAITTAVIGRDGSWRTGRVPGLAAAVAELTRADVAVPALHGPWGEDGGVQGFLETLGVPYVGSGVLASATCMDKARTKVVLAAAGIAVAPGRVVREPLTRAAMAELARELGLPLFVKPVCAGSSYGVSRVMRAADLPEAIALAARFGRQVLVERALHGPEVDIGVLELPGGELWASPPLAIDADPGEPFFTTRAKYASDRTRFVIPAPIAPEAAEALRRLALDAIAALGCAGLARVDCFIDPDLGPVVNEVNTFPGFTERSQFPTMWQAAGIAFADLVRTLVDTALAERSLTHTA